MDGGSGSVTTIEQLVGAKRDRKQVDSNHFGVILPKSPHIISHSYQQQQWTRAMGQKFFN